MTFQGVSSKIFAQIQKYSSITLPRFLVFFRITLSSCAKDFYTYFHTQVINLLNSVNSSNGHCVFPRAAITKYQEVGGLHNRNVLSGSSEGQQSKVTGSAKLVPSQGYENLLQASHLASGNCWQSLVFLGLQKHNPNLCLNLHREFSLCACYLCPNFPVL